MRPVLEAIVKSALALSGMELAVSVALLAMYMWFTARTPLMLKAVPIQADRAGRRAI
jgi:hypothetical protein